MEIKTNENILRKLCEEQQNFTVEYHEGHEGAHWASPHGDILCYESREKVIEKRKEILFLIMRFFKEKEIGVKQNQFTIEIELNPPFLIVSIWQFDIDLRQTILRIQTDGAEDHYVTLIEFFWRWIS